LHICTFNYLHIYNGMYIVQFKQGTEILKREKLLISK